MNFIHFIHYIPCYLTLKNKYLIPEYTQEFKKIYKNCNTCSTLTSSFENNITEMRQIYFKKGVLIFVRSQLYFWELFSTEVYIAATFFIAFFLLYFALRPYYRRYGRVRGAQVFRVCSQKKTKIWWFSQSIWMYMLFESLIDDNFLQFYAKSNLNIYFWPCKNHLFDNLNN